MSLHPAMRRTERQAPSTIPFPRQTQPKVNFQFAMIPDAIMRDTEIYPGAKILFGVILSSCRRGRCWMGNPELARSSGPAAGTPVVGRASQPCEVKLYSFPSPLITAYWSDF